MSYNNDTIRDEYFKWIYDCMCKGRVHKGVSYIKLFRFLHETEFTYSIIMDENRALDGVDLRYRFAMEIYNDPSVEYCLRVTNDSCSVLEMLAALAIRCEETIMEDSRYGNRTSQWFWSMLSTMGVSLMTDDVFDEEYVAKCVYTFLNREYEPDGAGGIFYIRNCEEDLRDMEIWTQLCWYLNKID